MLLILIVIRYYSVVIFRVLRDRWKHQLYDLLQCSIKINAFPVDAIVQNQWLPVLVGHATPYSTNRR